MELIVIEKKVFEALAQRIEHLVRKAEMLDRREGEMSLSQWLDHEDACRILGISKASLHEYRRKGLLAYSQRRHKIVYRAEDIYNMLEASRIKREENEK